MLRRILCLGFMIAASLCVKARAANEYWQALNGPYWVNGIDVAYGSNYQTQAWHRYLIGTNGSDRNLLYWRGSDSNWKLWNYPMPAANKLISYKLSGYGNIAFCSAYGDDIYKTTNGGGLWSNMNFPGNYNKHFSSVEVPNASNNAGYVVMVATGAIPGVPSTYYTEDGSTWNPIGTNSTIGWQVNDIESYPESAYPPWMAIGTSDGIYRKLAGGWTAPWEYAAFDGANVPVLESVDLQADLAQIAAVQASPDGRCNLYYTSVFPPWSSYDEIKPGGGSFNRAVRDIAAVYWGDSRVSCYAATDEGIYLVTFGTDPALANIVPLNYSTFSYDTDFKAVDYRFAAAPDSVDTAFVLAASSRGIYEITEVRDAKYQIISIKVTDITRGTYRVNPPAATEK